GVSNVRAAGGVRAVRGSVVRRVHGRRRAGGATPRPRPLRHPLQRHRRALLLHPPLGLTVATSSARRRGGSGAGGLEIPFHPPLEIREILRPERPMTGGQDEGGQQCQVTGCSIEAQGISATSSRSSTST